MKNLLIGCTVLAAFAVIGSVQAKAGTVYYSIGRSYVRTPYVSRVYRPTVYPRRSLVWHDTSHADYIPGRWVVGPFGMRYVPGRYVWHNEGHFDAVPTVGHYHFR